MIYLDTSFVVDLLRETRRQQSGPATAMRARLENEEVWISVYVACELFAGAELARNPATERERVLNLCAAVQIGYPDERFAATYGRLLAALQGSGRTVGTMDLLIGTAALVEDAPLLTRNAAEFSRIPNLTVIGY